MYHEMKIAGVTRKLPICKINDNLSIAGFVLFGDVEMTKAAATELLKKAPEFDILMTAEAKSIPLIYEMARQAGHNEYVIARKGEKLYMQDIISTDVYSITTANVQRLCIGKADKEMLTGKRVLIVDDVISTGESLTSIEVLLSQVDCEIVGKMAVLAEGIAIERDDIICLENLPLFDNDGNPLKE